MNDTNKQKRGVLMVLLCYINTIKPFKYIQRMKKPFKYTFLYITNFKKRFKKILS